MTAPNREQVAKWAQEVGFTVRNGVIKVVHSNGSWSAVNERLAEFSSLAYAAGQAAEREACAQIVERNAAACDNNAMLRDVLMSNAAAIRKRGEDENIS